MELATVMKPDEVRSCCLAKLPHYQWAGFSLFSCVLIQSSVVK